MSGVARGCQEIPGVVRSFQDVPGVVREGQKESGGFRMFQGLSGVARTCLEKSVHARISRGYQELSGSVAEGVRMCQELPGVVT